MRLMRLRSMSGNLWQVLRGGIFIVLLVVLAGCKVDLHSKLSESEANEMVAVLLRSGIPATRTYAKDGTSTIQVDESRFADAVAVLSASGLPREKFATIGEVFADNKLISSPTEERARFIYALSQELSRTISEIDGVYSARIHVVLPRNDPLRLDEKPSSASVFIKHDPTAPVVKLLPQIKTLVTNSIEGLVYEKVSVVFVPSEKTLEMSQRTGTPQIRFAGFTDWTLAAAVAGVAGWLIAMTFGLLWWRAQNAAADKALFMEAPPRTALTYKERDGNSEPTV